MLLNRSKIYLFFVGFLNILQFFREIIDFDNWFTAFCWNMQGGSQDEQLLKTSTDIITRLKELETS